jgi:hypothetical protein
VFFGLADHASGSIRLCEAPVVGLHNIEGILYGIREITNHSHPAKAILLRGVDESWEWRV